MTNLLAVPFLISAIGSALLCRIFLAFADRLGLNKATRTGGTMPLVGGLGLFLAILLALAAYCIYRGGQLEIYKAFFLPQLLVLPYFILGLYDDLKALKPLPKLGFFIGAAILQFILLDFLNFPGRLCIFLPLGCFFFSNSYNFLDNADGHSPMALLGLCLAIMGLGENEYVRILAIIVAAAIMGFLFWNFPRKAILYLGDAGSLYLGALAFLMALLSCSGSFNAPCNLPKLILLLAFPLYDTFAVMGLRVKRGQNPTIGGQDHYSHRLMRAGIPLWLVNLWTLLAASFGPCIIWANFKDSLWLAAPILWLFLGLLDFMAHCKTAKKAGN